MYFCQKQNYYIPEIWWNVFLQVLKGQSHEIFHHCHRFLWHQPHTGCLDRWHCGYWVPNIGHNSNENTMVKKLESGDLLGGGGGGGKVVNNWLSGWKESPPFASYLRCGLLEVELTSEDSSYWPGRTMPTPEYLVAWCEQAQNRQEENRSVSQSVSQ